MTDHLDQETIDAADAWLDELIATTDRAGIATWDLVHAALLLSGDADPNVAITRARQDAVGPAVLLRGIARAVILSRRYGSQEPPFDDHSVVVPGTLDRRVFNQAEVWVDFYAQAHQINDREDLTDDYLVDVCCHLLDNAIAWVPVGLLVEAASDAEETAAAQAWLRSTILWRALQDEAVRRDIEVPS